MDHHELSTTLAPLVHHVELSKTGWRQRTLELLVQAVLLETQDPTPSEDLLQCLGERLPAPLGRAQLESVTRELLRRHVLLEVPSRGFKLSEERKKELVTQRDSTNAAEARVRSRFDACFHQVGLSGQWAAFERSFLLPLVWELGARTYELVSGARPAVSDSATHTSYVNSISAERRPAVSQCIAQFIDPHDQDIRDYLLRQLNAAFLVQATGLPESALDTIARVTRAKVRLHVILDTNFLFSLIGLHENPADDVVDALRSIISSIQDRVEVKLYILPITIDESKRALAGYATRLAGLRVPNNVASAARLATQDYSGITLKYLSEAARAVLPLTAEDFFRPYQDDFLAVARSKGVELYNESLDKLRVDQVVLDDVLDQQAFEKNKKSEHRVKSYETLLHDVVLWHFVDRRRPARIESPLEAGVWVATIDFGFLGFDRHKRRTRPTSVPVCLHATVLLQLLQLWVPRSEKLDLALVDSLLPLLPHVFDFNAESVALKILRSMSRFDNAADLSGETVQRVLMNDALRSRIAGTEEIEEQIELVREALVDENRRLEESVVQAERKVAQLQDVVKARDETAAALRDELSRVQHGADSQVMELQRLLNEERRMREELAKRVATTEEQLNEERLSRRRRRALMSFLWRAAAATTVAGVAGNYLSVVSADMALPRYPAWVVHVTVWFAVIALYMPVVSFMAGRVPDLNPRVAVRLRRVAGYWWTVVVLGVLANVFVAVLAEATKR
ncbi:MAG: hypothetical protein AB1806_01935 [Acidobacteriota bacterium]